MLVYCALIVSGVMAASLEPPVYAGTAGVKITSDGVLVADLDRDGKSEIILGVEDGIVVLDSTAKMRPGFPVVLRTPADDAKVLSNRPPAACDLNGDGVLEIVAAASNHRLYALSADGASVKGFPVQLDGVPKGGVTCVEGSKNASLVLTTDSGSLLSVGAGGGTPKHLADVGAGAESGVAVGDLLRTGRQVFVVSGGNNKLYAFFNDGKTVPGFPYDKMSFRATGAPALGDVNNDGYLEIVVGSQDFKIHVIDRAGASLEGFPVDVGYRIYGGSALADLDDDGVLDVVVGAGNGQLVAVNGKGKTLTGFPVKIPERISTSVVVADVNRDGTLEIALAVQEGFLYLFDKNGKRVFDTPLQLGQKSDIAPAFFDLDGDKNIEIILATRDGKIQVRRSSDIGQAELAKMAWPMSGHDGAHSGRFFPAPGFFKDLSFETPNPDTETVLRPKYVFVDADGDPERDTQIRWYVNDVFDSSLNNVREIAAARTTKHQRWRYSVQEGDNHKLFGEKGILTRVFQASPIEINNSAPTRPAISVAPEAPFALTALNVNIGQPSKDVDGDKVEYRYLWLRNNKPVPGLGTASSVPAHMPKKNETWQVVVVPFDGETEGESALAAVTIRNTLPEAPEISVSPAKPTIVDAVTIKIDKESRDIDQDKIRYTYTYWVDGTRFDLPEEQNVIAPGMLRKHQEVRVRVTPWDDEGPGSAVETTFSVGNNIPKLAKIAIRPNNAKTADVLFWVMEEPPYDADGDVVSLTHRWFVDGKFVELPLQVPASQTQKGQKWRIELVPSDGEASGAALSSEIVIDNTAPTASEISLPRLTYAVDDEIRPRIDKASTDDDGDKVVLKYRWVRNGVLQKFVDAKDFLAPYESKKGERWSVRVISSDGINDSPGSELFFSFLNSIPSSPSIALSHERPTIRDRVSVAIQKEAQDKDKDPIQYHYRWYKNGQLLSDRSANSLDPLVGKKGERWRVEVRAFDGESEGESAAQEFVFQNHAPDVPVVQLTPKEAKTTDTLSCDVQTPFDVDGDNLQTRFRWFRNGILVDAAAQRLPAAYLRKGQTWFCEVDLYDGIAASQKARSPSVTILNSPPRVAVAAIAPVQPKTADSLRCFLTKPATDDDLDHMRYRYSWLVDGKPWFSADKGHASNEVPARATSRGQRWQCAVFASDGQIESGANPVSVVVDNTTPTSPKVVVLPEKPNATQPLRCEIVKAAIDADNDATAYSYLWYKNGVLQNFASTSSEVPIRLLQNGDFWNCAVIARDDSSASTPGESSAVAIVGVNKQSKK